MGHDTQVNMTVPVAAAGFAAVAVALAGGLAGWLTVASAIVPLAPPSVSVHIVSLQSRWFWNHLLSERHEVLILG